MAKAIDKETKLRLMGGKSKDPEQMKLVEEDGQTPKEKPEKRQKRLQKVGSIVPSVDNKICAKCQFFKRANSPFLNPIYRKNHQWVEGWPEQEDTPEGGWVVVIGEIPDMDADKSGSIMQDANFQWLTEFADEYPECREQLLYAPSMLCRPNLPHGDEVPPCKDLVRMTRTQAFKCGRSHILKRIHLNYQVDRVIAVGWSGALVAANNMGIDHVAHKLLRNPDYKWLTMPIRGMEYLAYDPTSNSRNETVIDDWTWALTFEDKRGDFKLPYRWIVTPEQLDEWMAGLLSKPEHRHVLFFDVETSGVDVFKNGFLVGLFSMYYRGAAEAILIPIALPDSAALYAEHAARKLNQPPDEPVENSGIAGWPDARLGLMRRLRKIVTSHTIKKVGHNLGYDANAMRACKSFGWKMNGIFNDTMYLHYLLDPDNNGMKDLGELMRTHMPEIPDYWEELDEYRAKHQIDNFLLVPSSILGPYAAYDTYLLDELMRRILKKIDQAPGGTYVTGNGISESVSRLTYAMFGRANHLRLCTHLDYAGQKVDTDRAHLVKKSLVRQLDELRAELAKDPQVIQFEELVLPEMAAKSKQSALAKQQRMGMKLRINWSSPVQLRAFFIGLCNLPILRHTETGMPCLDEGVIQDYATEYDSPVCGKLLKIREMEKFVTSFLDPMIHDKKSVIRDDGLIHASYRGAAIATGRLSASRPNVTALPRDGAIKHLYISRHPNGWVVTRDYSGIEIRIMALVSRCPVLLRILNEGEDVHFNTQKYFFKDKANKKNKTQRTICKQCFFGNIYGQGDQGLFDLLKAGKVINEETGEYYTLEECHNFNTMLYEAYPGVGEWVKQAHVNGIVQQFSGSCFGFVRNLPSLASWEYSRTIKSLVDYDEIKKDPNYRKLTGSVAKDLRRAQNAPVQSGAGDLTSFAAMRIQEIFEKDGKGDVCTLFATVHDDLWCLTLDCEALTKEGWKRRAELSEGDEILTKNISTGVLEWQPILAITDSKNREVVHWKHNGIDVRATPNHRWLATNKYGVNKLVETSVIFSHSNGYYKVHRSGEYCGKEAPVNDDLLTLIGWLVTDGCLWESGGYWRAYICQTKEPLLSKMREHIRKMGIQTYEDVVASGCTKLMFYTDTVTLLREFVNDNRILKTSFISTLSKRQAKVLIEAMWEGDGTCNPEQTSRSMYFETQEECDVFQYLGVIAGVPTSCHKRKGKVRQNKLKCGRVIKSKTLGYRGTLLSRDTFTGGKHPESYNRSIEDTWCPSVANKTWVCRSNGYTFITGNCDVRDYQDVPYVVKTMEDIMDNPADWMPDVLPGFDSDWMRAAPIFGECDLGISPKDAVGGKIEGGKLMVSLSSKDISYLTGKEHVPDADDTNPKEPKLYQWDFLDVAPQLRELLSARREEKLLSL